MIEPSLAFRTALRADLVNDAGVAALVAPDQIRAGSSRPGNVTCIALAGEQTQFLGRAAGGQLCARVWCDLHIWAPDGSGDLAQEIGAAVAAALFDAPASAEIAFDDYERPSIRYLRDPAPERAWTHGHAEVSAVVRWHA